MFIVIIIISPYSPEYTFMILLDIINHLIEQGNPVFLNRKHELINNNTD